MKIAGKFLMLLTAPFLIQAYGQQPEMYWANNLGRILEIAGPEGLYATPHTLIGTDTAGMRKQANRSAQYKIFGIAPVYSDLNPYQGENSFNFNHYFGLPRGNDAIEIRYGFDSSRYWIGPARNKAPNQLPFSVYNVGPRSSSDTAVTGGIKLCVYIQEDPNGNGLYDPGEAVKIFGDLATPFDSTYQQFVNAAVLPFQPGNFIVNSLRTGRPDISYQQTYFDSLTGGALPPPGTVIRLVPWSADLVPPIVVFAPDTIYQTPKTRTYQASVYSINSPNYYLMNPAPGMSIDMGGQITWTVDTSQIGQTYRVTIRAENGYGSGFNSFTAVPLGGMDGIVEVPTEGTGNLLRLWQRNDGSIAYRAEVQSFGLEYPVNSGHPLIYAGGLYIGGKKPGTAGAPDTVSVSDILFQSEFQPGRILNTGPLHQLITEDYAQRPTFFMLPEHARYWPAGAPRKLNGEALQLSVKDTWTVFNDLNPSSGSYDPTALSPWLGIEVQRQTFQFRTYPLDHAVLVRLRIINKSDKAYDSCYVALWQDPDVGLDYADFAMADSGLSAVVIYSDTTDAVPTACGITLLEGPLAEGSVKDVARITDIGPEGFYAKTVQRKYMIRAVAADNNWYWDIYAFKSDWIQYSWMKGLDHNGNQKSSGPFTLTSYPSDQRIVFSSGPFRFAPSDTQNIWYAYTGGTGINHASARDTILFYSQRMREIFSGDMNQYLESPGEDDEKPAQFCLYPNYPNPFNSSTTLRYELRRPSKVRLKIFNVLGQKVRTLLNEHQAAGLHAVRWDGKNDHGAGVGSGVYIVRIDTPQGSAVNKMILIK